MLEAVKITRLFPLVLSKIKMWTAVLEKIVAITDEIKAILANWKRFLNKFSDKQEAQ